MRIHTARTKALPESRKASLSVQRPSYSTGGCTVRVRVSDTRCGTYVICPAYLQSGALPAELHAHSRSHSDSKAFTAVPKSIPSHFRCQARARSSHTITLSCWTNAGLGERAVRSEERR